MNASSSRCQLGKVAILGAGGFVGSRLVEVFHLSELAEVTPVVRRVAAMARSSRFDLPVALADCRDQDQLEKTLVGCTSVVDCTVGLPAQIEAGARSLIPAAKAAGVRRVVYISSASVHGQNPQLGSSECTPLSDRQEMAYNNAKVRAERQLFDDAIKHGIELFVLRPSIVFGPRDRWISSLIQELRSGMAWLIEEGQGICNTIYVDNLIEAIRCCLLAPASAAGSPYLVGDEEKVTWADLYVNTAVALGIGFETVHQLPVPPETAPTFFDRLNEIRVHPSAQRLIAAVPRPLKGFVKGGLSGLTSTSAINPWLLPASPGIPTPSREMVLLQKCRHRFPSERAAHALGYRPLFTFAEGLNRTLSWADWAAS